MPAVNKRQQHLAQMALAYKSGATLEGVSKAGMAKVKQMAEMSDTQLKEFAHTKQK